MRSYIFLERVNIYAYHGVAEQEKVVGNTFIIDIRVGTNLTKAMETDALSDTINYAGIYRLLCQEMSTSSELLEHVAGRIVKRIFSEYPNVESIEIKLAKENPPMGADIAGAGVEIHCNRSDLSPQ